MCLLVVCIHAVSLPYRFTLLSNRDASRDARPIVSLPYRFTLLSNKKSIQNCYPEVSLPYRFTLLSNEAIENYNAKQFHYPIDLHYSQTSNLRKRPAIAVKSIGSIQNSQKSQSTIKRFSCSNLSKS